MAPFPVLRRYRAAGVTSGALLASQAVVGLVVGAVSAAVVVAAGAAVYGLRPPDDIPAVVLAGVVGLVASVVIGISIGLSCRTSRTASTLGNLVFIPSFLLGGGGPPRAAMSGPMRFASDVLPLSHVVGGIRLAWLGSTDDPHHLWYPAAVAVAAAGLALVTARRSEMPS